jgi:sugar lactone lactonase YvrE
MNAWRPATVGAILLAGLAACGCHDVRGPAAARFEPVCFPSCQEVPRVVVYGNLLDDVPAFDSTPALQRFLYGPDTVGKTPLRHPQGMIAMGTRMLICDQGQPDVVALNIQTGRSERWSDPERRPRCPVDIVVEGERIFVADTSERVVLIYSLGGRLLDRLVPDGEVATFRPASVAVHEGVLYVGDVGRARIERYDLDRGQWLTPFAPQAPREFRMAPTGLAVGRDGVLLIADSAGGTIWRVTPKGQWLDAIGHAGRGPGQFVRPKQVAVCETGFVLVTDAGRQSVLVFGDDGRFVTEVHERQGRWAGWTMPAGLLTVRPQDGELWNLCVQRSGGQPADSYVIVSDALGGGSLIVLGIIVEAVEDLPE